MKEELRGFLSTIGLTLSEEKTKVTHITEGFIFLGYKIIRSMGGSGKMAPKVLIPEKAIKRFQYQTRAILAVGTESESVTAKIQAQNQFTRGWCQYYCCTSSPAGIFGKLSSNELFKGMAHWLGRKYKLDMSDVMYRFRKGNTFGTKAVLLTMPNEFKAKKLLTKTWHNPYTAKEAIRRERFLIYERLWSGAEPRKGWGDIREEVMLLKGTTCYVCGTVLHPSEVEIDHFATPRFRFKDKTEADRMKHLQPICTSCHRAKTKIDLKVLSRMP